MPFTGSFASRILKRVTQTFATSLSPADTGQEMVVMSGAATAVGGNLEIDSADTYVTVTQGMGEPDTDISIRYDVADSGAGDKPGISFWGTSSSGGTWWTAYPNNSTSVTYYRFCNTPAADCTSGTTQTCFEWGVGAPPSGSCTPSGCGSGCGTTCTTYGPISGSGAPVQFITGGACGTMNGYCPSGSSCWAKCCSCNAGGTSCTGTISSCSTSGCTPTGCNSCAVTNQDTTNYNTRIIVEEGTLTGRSRYSTTTIATSTSSYLTVGGLRVTTAGDGVSVRAYANTTLTSQRGSTASYTPSSPTKGDYVGVYSPVTTTSSGISVDRFTATS